MEAVAKDILIALASYLMVWPVVLVAEGDASGVKEEMQLQVSTQLDSGHVGDTGGIGLASSIAGISVYDSACSVLCCVVLCCGVVCCGVVWCGVVLCCVLAAEMAARSVA